ncbi:MAG: PBSX family phage terminase large subunit [Pseudoalteromonas sp.]|uniref:PBSX family phage terminase large subunit n=1 Tax=Pseudoalteromonas sp. TaxID=53249 RepID=UPI001E0BC682|nr:PBSX family phage terminase large subunit [Pseudoalteromonas sp.]NRA78765.1 PBSX family phage terminase large subunit [Pseudoalteromonas sp.]
MVKQINLNDKYIPLFKDNSRYYIITGGRGSGKSFGVAMFLLNLTYEQGHKVLYTRYTLTSASTSIIPEFIEKINLMGKHSDFRITKDEIMNLTTGSSIIFKGIRTSSGNQTAALKSLNGITTFVVDEAEELVDEETFDKIDLSVRVSDRANRVILILNPTTKEHWIYKRYFRDYNVMAGSNTKKNNTTYIHTTYKDNIDNLERSFVNTVLDMKRRNPVKYEQQILGGWREKAEGTIITNWRQGAYIDTELTCYGQDFGFSNDLTTLVKVSVDKVQRKAWVKEIYGKPNLSTKQVSIMNNKECGSSLIICDNSEPRLINELKQYGSNIRPTIKKQGSILSGIALMQDFEIIVDKDSSGIIRELNNYVWKEKKEVPIDDFNHYIDAIRYCLMYLIQGIRSGTYAVR